MMTLSRYVKLSMPCFLTIFTEQFSIDNIISRSNVTGTHHSNSIPTSFRISHTNSIEWQSRQAAITATLHYQQLLNHYLQQSNNHVASVNLAPNDLKQPFQRTPQLPIGHQLFLRLGHPKRQRKHNLERKPRQAYTTKQLERLEQEFQVMYAKIESCSC